MRKYCTIALLALVSAAAPAATISLEPALRTFHPGDSFTLSIDVASVVDLYAFEVSLAYDPAVVTAVASAQGPFFPAASSIFIPAAIDNLAGTASFLSVTMVGLIPGVNGSGTMATIDFLAGSPGTSPVTITDAILLDSNLNLITTDITGSSIVVEPITGVPEPATAALLGASLALAWLLRWGR